MQPHSGVFTTQYWYTQERMVGITFYCPTDTLEKVFNPRKALRNTLSSMKVLPYLCPPQAKLVDLIE